MTIVEDAERKSRMRAHAFLFLAALGVALMIFNLGAHASDFTRGLWLGVLAGSALNLMPIKRWLLPRNAVVRLLEDDGVRENRRISCTVGLWGATLSAIIIAAAVGSGAALTALDASEMIATAAISSAMLAFATLELRAAR